MRHQVEDIAHVLGRRGDYVDVTLPQTCLGRLDSQAKIGEQIGPGDIVDAVGGLKFYNDLLRGGDVLDEATRYAEQCAGPGNRESFHVDQMRVLRQCLTHDRIGAEAVDGRERRTVAAFDLGGCDSHFVRSSIGT